MPKFRYYVDIGFQGTISAEAEKSAVEKSVQEAIELCLDNNIYHEGLDIVVTVEDWFEDHEVEEED